MDRRGPRSGRRRAGFRGLDARFYLPRRGPAKASRWSAPGMPALQLDEHGTPVRRGPGTSVAPADRAIRRAAREKERGLTKAQRYAVIRQELKDAGFPTGPTRATLARIDREERRRGGRLTAA